MLALEEFSMQDLALIVLGQISQNPTQKGRLSETFEIVCSEGLFWIFCLNDDDGQPVLLAKGPMMISKDY